MMRFYFTCSAIATVLIAALLVWAYKSDIANWGDANTEAWLFLLALMAIISCMIFWLGKKDNWK